MSDSFVFYRSFARAMAKMPAEACKELLMMVCDYALDGVDPDDDSDVACMFELIRPQIDANEKRREAGRKGGSASKAEKKPTDEQAEADVKQTEAECKQNEAEGKQAEADVKQTEANVNVNANVNDKKKNTKKKVADRASPRNLAKGITRGLDFDALVNNSIMEALK